MRTWHLWRHSEFNMSFKIQSKTILGWMDLCGIFPSIQDAQEKIPIVQDNLFQPPFLAPLVLRIVSSNESAINDGFIEGIDQPNELQ